MADLSMEALLGALQTTQAAKSKAKLSERNVVELVNKLKALGILGEDLLHTINGREYITVPRLQADVQAALSAAGGRLALVELPAMVGVDLYHCERQAAAIVAASGGSVVELQGELITTAYFDNIAAEMNDMLQEAGKVPVSDLAVQYALNTELLMSSISSRLGAAIHGRLEAGLLYTPAYLRNIKAQLRGALRGVSSPTTLPALAKELGLDSGGSGPGGGGVLALLTEELVQEGSVLGSLKGGSVNWVPAIYAASQQDAVQTFYTQNGWVGYDTVRRAGITNERAYLRSAFPDGVALDTAFCGPSLTAQIEGAAEDVAATGSWVDVLPLLPSALGAADVAQLVEKSSGVQALVKQEATPAPDGCGEGVHIMAGTCIVSNKLLQSLQQRADDEARSAAEMALRERKASGAAAGTRATGAVPAATAANGSGSKGGPGTTAASDSDDDWGAGTKGSSKGKKKGGKGGKGGKGAKLAAAKSSGDKAAAGSPGSTKGSGVSAKGLAAKVLEWQDDMLGAGDGGDRALANAIAQVLLPGAMAAYERQLSAAFTAGAEARRRAREAAGKALEESLQKLLLFGRGVEHFAGNEATYGCLQRHLARTTGQECVDLMYRWVQSEQDTEDATAASTSAHAVDPLRAPPLTALERATIAAAAPVDVAAALSAAAEALGGTTVKDVESSLEHSASQLGVRMRKADKKADKAAVAAYRQRLLEALAAESEPTGVLALAVPLLVISVTGKAASLPGKAIGGVLTMLQQQLAPELYSAVSEYHGHVVSLLKAQPGGTEFAVQLAQRTPALKAALGLDGVNGAPAASASDAATGPAAAGGVGAIPAAGGAAEGATGDTQAGGTCEAVVEGGFQGGFGSEASAVAGAVLGTE